MMKRSTVSSVPLVLCLPFILGGCGGDRRGEDPAAKPPPALIVSEPLRDRAPSRSEFLFDRIAPSQSGVGYDGRTNAASPSAEPGANFAGGVCIGDFDGDGFADIYLPDPHGVGHALYRNRGDFTFEEVAEQAGVRAEGMAGRGASFIDIDNDDDLDLYVCGYMATNRLFINHGDGTFSEQAAAYRLDFFGASIMMAFEDYDLDGDLDGYLVTYSKPPDPYADRVKMNITFEGDRAVVDEVYRETVGVLVRDGKYTIVSAGQFDRLYRNEGNGTFKDVSREAGIEGADQGLSATWWDADGDGYPDLYVGNDFYSPDRLYWNNRNGTFTEISAASLPHTPWYSMGADASTLR